MKCQWLKLWISKPKLPWSHPHHVCSLRLEEYIDVMTQMFMYQLLCLRKIHEYTHTYIYVCVYIYICIMESRE